MISRYQRKITAVLWSLAAVCLLALSWAAPLSAEISIDRLTEICEKGTAGELAQALAPGTNVNVSGKSGYSPLVSAILSAVEPEKKIALLLEAGADPNFIPKSAMLPTIPVSLAASNGRTAVVKMLLEAGAEVNAQDRNGYTPLIWGCLNPSADDKTEESRRQMFELFLAGGADLNLNRSGIYCLLFGASGGEPETIRLMLAAGIPVNGTDKTGTTALMMAAAFSSDPAVAALLLEKGADPELRDRSGHTALDYARGLPGNDFFQG